MKETWNNFYKVKEDGFYGHLYLPQVDLYQGKAVLVLGGGGVPYKLTLDEAKAFASLGITALAVGYFNVEDTPKTIVEVPIEYVDHASNKLHALGYHKVIVAGISKGAELALVASSYFDSINGVIAFSPSNKVYMAVGPHFTWLDASSWSYQGKPLPYAYTKASLKEAIRYSIQNREMTFRTVYERADINAPLESYIKVEKIKGPILLVCSTSDSLWPSEIQCKKMMKRLEKSSFEYSYTNLAYPYASHLLLPFDHNYLKLFKVGRKYPKESHETIQTLQKEMIQWLKNI